MNQPNTSQPADANGATRSYLGEDASDLRANARADGAAQPTADPGPLARGETGPMQLLNPDGTAAAVQPPPGHPADETAR